jgi:hypothetical protein
VSARNANNTSSMVPTSASSEAQPQILTRSNYIIIELKVPEQKKKKIFS